MILEACDMFWRNFIDRNYIVEGLSSVSFINFKGVKGKFYPITLYEGTEVAYSSHLSLTFALDGVTG